MTWAPTEAQKAIFAKLANDATLQTLLGTTPAAPKVYDHIPQEEPWPFISIQIKPLEDRGNQTLEGVEFRYQVNVWYRAPGRGDLKVQEIQGRIDELLHRQDICIDGWNIISHRRSTVDILDEDDGVTKHGVQIFTLMLGEV